ncbi:MAG: peptidoglycan-binding protein [Vampirovibrionales bacterium]|nr:peptidoglycan-binding protein [Vampirovibrionales bacterium]
MRGLPPTGEIDARTLAALGFEVDQAASDAAANNSGFSSPGALSRESLGAVTGPWRGIAQAMFPDAPRGNIDAHLPAVLQALAEAGLTQTTMTLAALATIRAESAGFAPIGEYQSSYNTDPGGRPYGRYDFRRDLGNGAVGDGARYRGRGFIQLTGRSNYETYSQRLGLGDALTQNPDLANDPLIAARILAAFLADKAATIQKALAQGDFATARKAVNGGVHGLAQFTQAFQQGAQVCQANGAPIFV